MGNQLTTEQVLLLNNLMYMESDRPLEDITKQENCWTVKDIIDAIVKNDCGENSFKDDKNYGSFITGKDWKNIVKAIQSDSDLMKVQIRQTYKDEAGGKGVSALFVNPASNEAVVVYRGTSSGEWKDNFIGGGPTNMPDGVSTPYQENALEWYQSLDLSGYDSVTVSGHSKGGNKAKYITLMDGSVDRCISFDGQGFSDEFIEKYSGEISARQSKIENHNVDSDYVNLLLNDVGECHFYEGQDLGEAGFLENHCPNTFMKFNEDGTFTMVEGERSSAMTELDEFLNSYLRTASREEKVDKLNIFANLADVIFNSPDDKKIEDTVHYLLLPESAQEAAKLLAYFSKYTKDNPEMVDEINGVLTQFGLGGMADIVSIMEKIINWKYFDDVAGFIGGGLEHLPGWAVEKLQEFIADKLDIELNNDELLRLLGLVSLFVDERKQIDSAQKNGADITVPSSLGGHALISCCPESVRRIGEDLSLFNEQIRGYADQVLSVKGSRYGTLVKVNPKLAAISTKLESYALSMQKLANAAYSIADSYEKTEEAICFNISG